MYRIDLLVAFDDVASDKDILIFIILGKDQTKPAHLHLKNILGCPKLYKDVQSGSVMQK